MRRRFLHSPNYLRAAWFPGAKFKRQAKEWAKHAFRLRESPFESVKAAIVWLYALNFVISINVVLTGQRER